MDPEKRDTYNVRNRVECIEQRIALSHESAPRIIGAICPQASERNAADDKLERRRRVNLQINGQITCSQ
jgi:hypothetical protein